jgi:hypothetical protein
VIPYIRASTAVARRRPTSKRRLPHLELTLDVVIMRRWSLAGYAAMVVWWHGSLPMACGVGVVGGMSGA